MTITGPLGNPNLANQFWLQPRAEAHLRGGVLLNHKQELASPPDRARFCGGLSCATEIAFGLILFERHCRRAQNGRGALVPNPGELLVRPNPAPAPTPPTPAPVPPSPSLVPPNPLPNRLEKPNPPRPLVNPKPNPLVVPNPKPLVEPNPRPFVLPNPRPKPLVVPNPRVFVPVVPNAGC